jgi:hypothetical protein
MQNIEYRLTDRSRENFKALGYSITKREPQAPRQGPFVKRLLKIVIGVRKGW